jgi:mRNA-degrading endonuclease RelE of RelBE toxin-antitoxin system
MRDARLTADFRKDLIRLARRDKDTFEALLRKMREIQMCPDVDHYKNLRAPLNHLKRVHIRGPFVLLFRHLPADNAIEFYGYGHHDDIYSTHH